MWLHSQEQLIPGEVLDEHRRILTALEKRRHERGLQLLAKHRQRSKRFLATLGDGAGAPAPHVDASADGDGAERVGPVARAT
jgi:DNA-binding GntR family transcriptional regulator